MIDFEDKKFFNNEEVKKNLENIIKSNLLSNGYIFYGPDGIGKKQTAFQFVNDIFEKYSSSSNIKQKIKANNHPDFLLIEPTYIIKGNLINRSDTEVKNNNKETIRIDQIRKIKQFLAKKSIESEKKIILVIDAHLLNEAASNCLLKTLEEPTNGIFILLTSKIDHLIDTVKSRCQLIRFRSFSYKEIKNLIKDNVENKTFEIDTEKDFQYFVNSCNGSPGKIIENIAIWKEIPKEIKDNLKSPISDNLEILRISSFISEKLENFQQIFLINFMQNKWWAETQDKKIIQDLEILKKNIKNNIQPRLAWEVTLLKIANESF